MEDLQCDKFLQNSKTSIRICILLMVGLNLYFILKSACNAGDPSLIPGSGSSPEKEQLPTSVFLGFPGGSDGKESTCNVGDLGLIPGLGRSPRGGHDNPLQYACLENPHGQRNLVGYSPWDHKELDMTE